MISQNPVLTNGGSICYDQFLEYWPLANEANDFEFQRSSIDLDTFYSGSKRLQFTYTKEEYDVLKHTIHCPRCGATLQANMWVYDLPFAFDIDTFEFELEIEKIAELSITTPFLLLKNEFALKIHDLLHDLVHKTTSVSLDTSLYRARIAKQVERLHFDEFTVAPKQFIQEGRYNHAGEQVLYLASDMLTCFNEVNQKLCFIAECEITKPIKILDLTAPTDSHIEYQEDLNALVFSALMSKRISTSGWHKPAYVFSRFVSDCAKSAGFDAIRYPSTKAIKNNFNLVIVNEDIFNEFTIFKNLFFYDGRKSFNLEILS